MDLGEARATLQALYQQTRRRCKHEDSSLSITGVNSIFHNLYTPALSDIDCMLTDARYVELAMNPDRVPTGQSISEFYSDIRFIVTAASTASGIILFTYDGYPLCDAFAFSLFEILPQFRCLVVISPSIRDKFALRRYSHGGGFESYPGSLIDLLKNADLYLSHCSVVGIIYHAGCMDNIPQTTRTTTEDDDTETSIQDLSTEISREDFLSYSSYSDKDHIWSISCSHDIGVFITGEIKHITTIYSPCTSYETRLEGIGRTYISTMEEGRSEDYIQKLNMYNSGIRGSRSREGLCYDCHHLCHIIGYILGESTLNTSPEYVTSLRLSSYISSYLSQQE